MRTHFFLIGIVMLACGTLAFGRLEHAPDATTRQLTDAEPSARQLIDRFLGALARRDLNALHRLRVTETEYREILMPSSVAEGQPPRQPSKEFADLAWGLIDEKSRYYEQNLLYEYGGRDLKLRALTYSKGEKRFAGYTAHQQLRLKLEDTASGAELTLGTGSIVEVAGRYKFVSFIRD